MGLLGFLFPHKVQSQADGPQAAPKASPAAIADPRTHGPHLGLLCYFLDPKAALQELSKDWAAALRFALKRGYPHRGIHGGIHSQPTCSRTDPARLICGLS